MIILLGDLAVVTLMLFNSETKVGTIFFVNTILEKEGGKRAYGSLKNKKKTKINFKKNSIKSTPK